MVQPKELIYRNTYSLREVIADDYFKGVRFLCINIGDHPCSYICASQEFIDIHKDFYGEIPGLNVHGGVTHTGPINKITGLENYEGVWIGWNYGLSVTVVRQGCGRKSRSNCHINTVGKQSPITVFCHRGCRKNKILCGHYT